MPRILLSPTPLVSTKMISIVQQLIKIRDDALRLKDIMDEITTGGTIKNALENNAEVIGAGGTNIGAGNGTILYDAVTSILAGVNSATIKAIIKQFDRG